jgi:hypothetical protein
MSDAAVYLGETCMKTGQAGLFSERLPIIRVRAAVAALLSIILCRERQPICRATGLELLPGA